jgi:hypothetical protein
VKNLLNAEKRAFNYLLIVLIDMNH